jgi:hypothetical protein
LPLEPERPFEGVDSRALLFQKFNSSVVAQELFLNHVSRFLVLGQQ